MAYTEMTRQTTAGNETALFQYSEAVTGTSSGKWVFFPAGCNVSAIVTSTGGGKLQITNDSRANIEADTVAAGSIVDWDNGDTGADTKSSTVWACTAFRVKGISGTTTLYASANK